jgi:branched-chain amino acid transport system substrate-binding protein
MFAHASRERIQIHERGATYPGRCILVTLVGILAALPLSLIAKEDPLVIGAVYNLHGFQANLDLPSSRGARLAVADANRSGGLLGRRVELAVVDGVSRPKVIAVKTAALLKRFPDLPALIGLSDTDMVLAAAPVAADARLVFLTSGATSPLLPQQVPEFLFLACFGDNVQAAAAAESAWQDLEARSAAVLYADADTYTNLLQGYFVTRFTELGGVVGPIRAYTAGALDGLADGLLDVDLVFLASASAEEALNIIRLLRSAGVDAPVFGGDGYDSEELWQQAEVQDVYFTTHAYLGADSVDPLVQEFRAAYAAAYNSAEPDAFAALGFDTARLIMEAIRAAGTTTPGAVRQALAETRAFRGVTGTIGYPAGSAIPLKSVTILRVVPGGTELFRQLQPAGVPVP